MSKKDDYDKKILEDAILMRNFAIKVGAYFDPETHYDPYDPEDFPKDEDDTRHRPGQFKVPEVCEYFGWSQSHWREVYKKSVSIGEPITQHPFGGHYYGQPGDQILKISRQLKYHLTGLNNLAGLLEALQSTKDWDKCAAKMPEFVNLESLPQLFSTVGYEMSDEMSKKLLSAGI